LTTRRYVRPLAETDELRLLRDFFENAGLGLHWVGPDGTIVRANRADYEPLGYGEDEYVGHNIVEFHADQEVIDDILARLSRGERLQGYPARLRARDGSLRHVVIDSSVNFEDGEFVNTRCITRDVTDQVQAQRALHQSEARYALAAQASRIGAWEWDMGEEVQWTESLEEMYGFEPGTFPRTFESFAERLHPDDRERVFGLVNDAVASGEELDFEHRIVLRSGELKWLHGRGRIIADETGKPVKLVGIAVDITERKRAEIALRESEAKARAVLETAVDGIITIDEGGVIESFNPAAERIFGYQANEIVGHKINDLMPPPDREQHDEYIRNYVETGERKIIGIGREVIGRRKDGSTFPMDLSISEVHLGNQRIFTGLVRDITDRKEAESRLERMYEESRNSAQELEIALAAKDEFLGLMSHELRTPITTILGNAEILAMRGEVLDAEARRTASADIAEEAARLNTLITDLLTLARLERGKLEPEPLALGRLISQIIEEHSRKSAAPVDYRDFSEGAIVLGDENLIGQVMRNYLTNAEKYSPPGSRIKVVVERGDGEARVRVLDRGMGIDAAESERLFEPFYRSAEAQSIGGLGIGLAVCRRLIEAVGGELWAAPRDGGGSEFGFSLALCEHDPA
jgi:two-component system, OmpR family, sensor histidine kinase VicK